MNNENKALFEEMPAKKALMTMAVPTVISQLITTVYNIADTLFIGMSNDPYKVAAASLAGVLFFVMNSLANLFGVGGGSLLSRLLGEKREDEAKKVNSFSVYGTVVVGAVYSLICLLLSEPVVRVMGASDNTVAYAQRYLFWVVIIGGVPATVGMTLSHLIRSAGYAKESSIGLAIGGIANLILDPLFMFVLLPKGNEVAGAAIATMLSNVLSMLYFIYVCLKYRDRSVLDLSVRNARPQKRSIRAIYMVGLPSALSTLLASAALILKNNVTAGYGDIELAAFGIVQKIDMFPLNIGMGLCQGMMPLVAYNYAAQNYKRMDAVTKEAEKLGIVVSAVFITGTLIFAPQIIMFFIKDEATVSYGVDFLRIACTATPFIILNFQNIFGLQAMGKGKESLVLSFFRQGLLAIPIMYLLNHFFGLYGIVASQAVSDGISCVFSVVTYMRIYNRLMKKHAVNEKHPESI